MANKKYEILRNWINENLPINIEDGITAPNLLEALNEIVDVTDFSIENYIQYFNNEEELQEIFNEGINNKIYFNPNTEEIVIGHLDGDGFFRFNGPLNDVSNDATYNKFIVSNSDGSKGYRDANIVQAIKYNSDYNCYYSSNFPFNNLGIQAFYSVTHGYNSAPPSSIPPYSVNIGADVTSTSYAGISIGYKISGNGNVDTKIGFQISSNGADSNLIGRRIQGVHYSNSNVIGNDITAFQDGKGFRNINAIGNNLKPYPYSSLIGYALSSSSMGEVVVGVGNAINHSDYEVSSDYSRFGSNFRVTGFYSPSNTFGDIVTIDKLILQNDGLLKLPLLTNELIDSSEEDKVAVTKEWVNSRIPEPPVNGEYKLVSKNGTISWELI